MKAITDKVTNFILFYYSDDFNLFFDPYLKARSTVTSEDNNDVQYLFPHNCNIHESAPEIDWGPDMHIKLIDNQVMDLTSEVRQARKDQVAADVQIIVAKARAEAIEVQKTSSAELSLWTDYFNGLDNISNQPEYPVNFKWPVSPDPVYILVYDTDPDKIDIGKPKYYHWELE